MLNTLEEITALFDELFPIPRSITGEGYRKSLEIMSRYIPFQVHQTPSGTQAFDWQVPDEWVIEDAYLLAPDGRKILDFKANNLCIVNYSMPVDAEFELADLQPHLHSIAESPDWTPYVTSYYARTWGFCLPHSMRVALPPGRYRAVIKSSFKAGSVDVGTCRLGGGTSGKTVLLSSYLCHPSLANNELSGPLVLAALYDRISRWKNRRFDYLFVINPETIGSICFLYAEGRKLAETLQAGLVLTCLGGPHPKLSYKVSRSGKSSLDKLMRHLTHAGQTEMRPFDPSGGSDERQYCAAEFNLPVGQMVRTSYGIFPEYHNSGDDKAFVRLDQFPGTVSEIENILRIHEYCEPLRRVQPYCEIQLGRRGLYASVNSPNTRHSSTDTVIDGRQLNRALMYILSYADGEHDLVDISEMVGIGLNELVPVVERLRTLDVLK